MTGIPKRRYYVILIALIIFGTVCLAGVIGWAWWHDSNISRERDLALARISRNADYRGCVERNELRSVILTILEGATAQPLPRNATPEQHAYRQLLRSYVTSDELEPIDCLAILNQVIEEGVR